MGFFKSKSSGEPERDTSRAYLGRTQAGPTGRPMDRKGSLYMAALNRIADLPVASASAFGRPLADTFELAPASAVVRDLMRTDRSLHGWVARNGLVLFDVVLENMPGTWDQNLGTALGAVGITDGPRITDRWRAELSAEVCERVEGLTACVLQMFWVIAQPQFNQGHDRTYYDHVFSSTNDATRETAFDIAAWTAVVIGRLTAKGAVPRLPFYDRGLLTPPAMTEAGWYPNPFNYGDLVGGDATYQRQWDGADWTSRIRRRNGRGWNESTHSLATPPDN